MTSSNGNLFPRYWPFVRGINRSPVNSPHKDQWCGALMFSWICVCTNGCVNNCEAGNLRHHRAHYDVIVMIIQKHMQSVQFRHMTLLCLLSTHSRHIDGLLQERRNSVFLALTHGHHSSTSRATYVVSLNLFYVFFRSLLFRLLYRVISGRFITGLDCKTFHLFRFSTLLSRWLLWPPSLLYVRKPLCT